MPAIRFYAVAIGAQPGIYSTWEGKGGAREQVDFWPHATHKAFRTHEEAYAFIKSELFDKLKDASQSTVGDASLSDEADGVAGPCVQLPELTPLRAARLEAREKYVRSLPQGAPDSEDIVMGEEKVVKTEG